MSVKINDSTRVLAMKFIDTDTNEERPLFERENSKCFFIKDDLDFGDYIITLRIDWGDMNEREPILDADIYKKIQGRKKKKIKNGHWHHTKKELDSSANSYRYLFVFKERTLPLISQTTVGDVGVSGRVHLVE